MNLYSAPQTVRKSVWGLGRRSSQGVSLLSVCLVLVTLACLAGSAELLAEPMKSAEPLEAAVAPPEPRFDHLYDYGEIVDFLHGYAKSYPEWVRVESIGKTAEGRDLWLATVTNPKTGSDLDKPAMYIDGNTHANEVQGAETALYTLDFLVKNYGRLGRVTEMLDRSTFYILPVVNADGRWRWFNEPATANFPRTVIRPVDDDRDGLMDEDGFDDLNGDGVLTFMRKRVPMGEGRYYADPNDSRILLQAEGEQQGDWEILGMEGIDNDGDGSVNEDGIGYVDPNRTYGYAWQPRYVQAGSTDYPLQISETRSIAKWALEHPNVGAVQSYHNSGGMILRGPGSKIQPKYPKPDINVYDILGERGEELIPGYNYWVIWKDLYTAFGGTTDHFYGVHGAIAFTNELYQDDKVTDLDGDGEVSDEEEMRFNDEMTLGRRIVPWTEFDHPQYGKIEIGGQRHDVGRVPETWRLQEDIHRNHAFVLFHAHHLPKLSFGDAVVRPLGKKLWRIELPVFNTRAIPSVTAIARQNKLHRVDVVTVDGGRVVASGLVDDPYLDKVSLQEHRPERLEVGGIPGFGFRRLFLLVEGEGEVKVTYDSVKAGRLQTTVALEKSASSER